MTAHPFSIDELARDLGEPARLRVLLNVGGQRRHIPLPQNADGSALARELGFEATVWLAARFGGDTVEFPSRRGREAEDAAALLRAAVLEAGLTGPTRSVNSIAKEFGVTARRVRQVRTELRTEAGLPDAPDLPLFSHL